MKKKLFTERLWAQSRLAPRTAFDRPAAPVAVPAAAIQ
jgi:hypothetical protein